MSLSDYPRVEAVEWSRIQAVVSKTPSAACALGTLHRGPFYDADCLFLTVPRSIPSKDLQMLGAVRHSNVASMVGFAATPHSDETVIIYAWTYDFLAQALQTGSIGWDYRLKVASELTRLLHYLQTYVQCSLDSSCIGVDDDGRPQIFGVGIAELLYTTNDIYRLSPGYRCPVFSQSACEFNTQSRVLEFNLGVVLLELLTGRAPVKPGSLPLYMHVRRVYSEEFNKSLAAVRVLLDPSMTAEAADQLAERFLNISLACTADNPDDRPDLAEIWKYLDDLYKDQKDIAETLETMHAVCSTCGNDIPDGIFCEQGHYICGECLNQLVINWSTRRHVMTRTKGCIYCPKRFEFEGNYLQSRKALCEAAPWKIEDLKEMEVIREEVYQQYMERIFKSDPSTAGTDAKIFRGVSVKSMNSTDHDSASDGTSTPNHEKHHPSRNMKDLLVAVDDYGTIMTTMELPPVAEDGIARNISFMDAFEEQKHKIALEGRIIGSMKAIRDRTVSKELPQATLALVQEEIAVAAPDNQAASLAAERQVLMKLFNATEGSHWKKLTNWGKAKSFWGNPVTIGEWYHVSVNENGAVIEINLRSNRLKGTIPEDICSLQNLRTLNLSGNSLRGSIPDQISRLENLKGLHLNSNQLVGPIPDSISSLTLLVWLDLSQNKLTGSIPRGLSALKNLKLLALNNNLLNGDIPSELSALENLKLLGLHCNRFTGPMTEILKSNPTLKMTY